MTRRCRAVWVHVMIVLALTACGGSAPRRDNDVRVYLPADPTSLSLIGKTDANSILLASLISDGLVAYDAEGHYVPMVARAWELSPDGTALTFHLRDGVLWHDGQPVTSHDVAYTAKKIQDPATQEQSWASQFAIIASIETPDDRTVVVHYQAPYADALEPWRAPLLPEHIASKDANFLGGSFAHHPTGCGPFRFVSYDPGQSVVLAAFDRYWGGRPLLDRMIFKIVPAERTGYESLLMGELNLYTVTPDLWRESLRSPAGARLTHFVYYRLNTWRIDWNQYPSTPFFHDKRVRRALIMALDRTRFADTVTAGLARPGVSSFPEESPWVDPSIVSIPYDPEGSRRLLDEAGWCRPARGRVRDNQGKPFAFTMIVNAGSQELTDRVAAWMQQSLAEIGVTMRIEKLSWAAFRERRKSHAFEAAMGTMVFDLTPDRYDVYHSKARDDGFNYGGFSDPEIDDLLERVRSTIEPTARRELCDRLQKRLDDLQPISFLFQFAQPTLHDPELQGITTSPMGLYQFMPGPRAWHWSSAHARN